MYRFALIPCLAISLAACGGGTTGTSSYVENVKSYSDGSGVLLIKNNDTNGNPTNYVMVSKEVKVAEDIANGAYALNVVDSSSNGSYYFVQRTGVGSNGSQIKVNSYGKNLNSSGSEYASMNLVIIDGQVGVLSSGSSVGTLPSGSYTYTGEIGLIDSFRDAAEGTFTLSANFNTNKASIAASSSEQNSSNNTAYFFSGSNMQINQADGSFGTSSGLIGQTGVSSEMASIRGYFAGSNGQGVHGAVYVNDSSSPDLMGVFYGSR